jgi:hypothetical protein
MWPFSSSSQQLQQQQQQSQSKTTTDDLTKWQVDGDGENALPPTVTACAPIVMALQDFMAQSVLNQEQADTLMREVSTSTRTRTIHGLLVMVFLLTLTVL